MLLVLGAVASTVRATAVAAAVPPLFVARMVRPSAWPLVPGTPVLEQVKLGMAPETVAGTQVLPPSMLYSQLVTTLALLAKPVARSNGLLTKLPNWVFDGVTAPGVGGARVPEVVVAVAVGE